MISIPTIPTILGVGAGLALLAAGCTPETGYHPESDVPHHQARVHQSDYRGGEIERGELKKPDPTAAIEKADPPGRVGAAWSDPRANPNMLRVTAVVIETDLADLCGIDRARARFDYDSAKLDADAKTTVASLASCFSTGPLAGHEVEVLGHTDPRGSDAYNRELGMSRAESVADALVRNGLSESRIEVESHGEAEAHDNPDKWPADRRVDVRVNADAP